MTGERTDLKAQREAQNARRDAQYEAWKAERDARRAAEAEEEKRAAEEQAAEQRRIQAACRIIYQKKANRKVNDLTVQEEQQVRACQLLGLYQR